MRAAGGRPEDAGDPAGLERLERLARVMDSAFRVPGTNLRFGLDPLVGLIPGLGDSAMAMISLWIVYEAGRRGASPGTVARMLGNVALDAVVGSIPLLGDLFDARYRANLRNVELLRRSLQHRDRRARTGEQP